MLTYLSADLPTPLSDIWFGASSPIDRMYAHCGDSLTLLSSTTGIGFEAVGGFTPCQLL